MLEDNPPKPKKPGLLQIIVSVLAAMFGVQNSKNRQRDFEHGNPVVFIVVGIVLTVVLLFSLFFIVKLVIA